MKNFSKKQKMIAAGAVFGTVAVWLLAKALYPEKNVTDETESDDEDLDDDQFEEDLD